MGVSIMDHLTAEAYADKGIVLRRFEPALPCELRLIFPATQELSEPVKTLSSILRDEVARSHQAARDYFSKA